jgi:hypothetical protein
MADSVASRSRRNGSAALTERAPGHLAYLGPEVHAEVELVGHSPLRHDVGLERAALHSSDAMAFCDAAASALNTAQATGDLSAIGDALSRLRRSLDDMSQTVAQLRDPLRDVHMRLVLEDEPIRLGSALASAVQEWVLSLGRSDACDLLLDVPDPDILVAGDRRQLAILMVTLCEVLSDGGTNCAGIRLACRHDPSSRRAEVQLEIIGSAGADRQQFASATVTGAVSRCRLIARMHGGDLESAGSGRALVTLATMADPAAPDSEPVEHSELWLAVRPEAHIVEREGRRIRLSWTEWQLFAFLWDHPGVTFSRVELATGAWGAQWANRRGEVEIYISRIRRKVEHDARHPRVIRTVRGLGYRLDRN